MDVAAVFAGAYLSLIHQAERGPLVLVLVLVLVLGRASWPVQRAGRA